MRRSRKKRPDKPLIPRFNKNEYIKVPEVRVLDTDGNNIGTMTLKEAIALAKEKEMDLVEINPKANPPVTKIVEFGSFKYQKEKEAKKQKARSHVSEMKGIRLSIRISDHDMGIRQKQAEKFLNRGDKVRVEIILRGRERGKSEFAYETVKKFVAMLEQDFSLRYDQEPQRTGGKITAIVAKK